MSDKSTCATCNYQWQTGTDGDHICTEHLIKERDKLVDMLMQKVISDTMLTGFVAERGGFNIGLEGGACALLAGAFSEQLYKSDAENYIELTFKDTRRAAIGGTIIVTVRRNTGKTPHQLRAEAEAECERLRKLNGLAREFDAAPDDADWQPPHPIFQMAEEIDQLKAKLAAFEAQRVL